MSTKKIISDQVLYRLYGGVPDSSAPVQEEDVWKALEQKINTTFKMQHFEVTLAAGETIPDGAVLAFYENVAVTRYGNRSRSLLPVVPVTLPRNMGVFEVAPVPEHTGNQANYDGRPFIPLQAGQRFLLQADELLNDLLGQIGYEVKGKYVEYTKDLTLLGVDDVNMTLVVFDMSQYGITDVLPVPADYEEILINELVAQFSPVQPEIGLNNNFSNANQKSE
jgi:hypothetical protein